MYAPQSQRQTVFWCIRLSPSIDCIAVENEIGDNRFDRAELDWLIYNKPLEYADLVLNGEIEEYCKSSREHRLED